MTRLLDVERLEDPRAAEREAPGWIVLGDADEERAIDPDRTRREPAAQTQPRAAVGPDWRRPAARVDPAVQLTDNFESFAHGSRHRHTEGDDVVLVIAAHGVTENAEPDIADDSDGLRSLGDEERERKVRRVEAQSALVARVRQSRREANRERWPGRRLGDKPDLGAEHEILDIAGAVARDGVRVEHAREWRGGVEALDGELIPHAAIHLDLGDRSNPEAQSKGA